MLSFFQPNKNIKQRLWIVLLTLLIASHVSNRSLLSFPEDPVESVVTALYFFGYISIIEIGIFFFPYWALFLIQQIRVGRSQGSKRFLLLTSDDSWKSELLGNISGIVATILAIPGFGTPAMKGWGTLGLSFLLLNEIINFDRFRNPEFLKIGITKNNQISVQFLTNSKKEQFNDFDLGLFDLLSRLERSGWEQVESESNGSEKLIIMRRK